MKRKAGRLRGVYQTQPDKPRSWVGAVRARAGASRSSGFSPWQAWLSIAGKSKTDESGRVSMAGVRTAKGKRDEDEAG